MPGVVYGSARMGIDGQQTIGTRAMPGQIVGLSANGQRDTNQNITLDGVSATDGFKSSMLFVPSIEAIEEFKIQSAVYSAEYGMNSGAQANVAIKMRNQPIPRRRCSSSSATTCSTRAASSCRRTSPRTNCGATSSAACSPVRSCSDKTFLLANYEGAARAPRHSGETSRADRRHAQRRFLRDPSTRQPLVSERCQSRGHPRHPPAGQHRAVSQQHHPAEPDQSGVSKISHLARRRARSLRAASCRSRISTTGARRRTVPLNLAGTNDQIIDTDQYLAASITASTTTIASSAATSSSPSALDSIIR